MTAKRARKREARRRRGASLVLVLAIFGGLSLGLLLLCLGLTGLIGSYHEQRSAVEAAALVAAKDLSAIVIDDPNFGLVGLSDISPIGTNTAAVDGYYTQVTGINTLFGTIRLDMIIADYLQDPIMSSLATTDYNNAIVAQKNLVTALNAAVAGGTGTDAYGNTVDPNADAVDSYNGNGVHLAIGQKSTLVPGSLKMKLGYVTDLATRTPIPQPKSCAALASDDLQANGYYAPDNNISYTSQNTGATLPYVFAALGPNATLVDLSNFATSVPNLPFSTPTIVKVDADEQYQQNGTTMHVVHASAAAEAGTITDQRPFPGAFTISFFNGPLPEIVQPGDLINHVQIQADPTDIMQTPLNGDYPQNTMSIYSMPFLTDNDTQHPQFEHVFSVALYDWLRRGGANVNVKSLMDVLQTPMNFADNSAQIQRLHLTSTGAVTIDCVPCPQQNLGVLEKQYRAISGLGINSSNGHRYDLIITDNCRQPGRTLGGRHAGEPLTMPGPTVSNSNAASYSIDSMYENAGWPYVGYTSGSGVRPTYNTEGVAMDFAIRQRQ